MRVAAPSAACQRPERPSCLPSEATRAGKALWLALLVLAVLALGAWPSSHAWLEYNRAAVEGGQWWRIVTGNLVHYGWGHLAGDLAAFIVLCGVAPHRFRVTALVALLSAIAVGVGVYLLAGDVATYRGLSGVNYALLASALLGTALRDRGPKAVLLGAVLAAAIAKTAVETATGRLLVNVCLPKGVWVVGWAHAAGLTVGSAAALLSHARFTVCPACGRPRRPR